MTVTKWFYEITESDSDKYPEGKIMIQNEQLRHHEIAESEKFQAQFFDHKQGVEHTPTFTFLGKKQFDSEEQFKENVSEAVEDLREGDTNS